MAERILSALVSPRTWLVAAALCFVGWAAIGYHQSQIRADLVLGRVSGTDPDDLAPMRQILMGVAVTMIAVAGALSLPVWRRKAAKSERSESVPKSSSDASGAFQPIRTQEELSSDDDADAQPSKGRLSRMAGQVARSVFSARKTSKNQP